MRSPFPGQPYTFRPSGCCDAADGTNAPPGAMQALTNLIPDPSTSGVFVPRPGATLLTGNIPNTPAGAFISAALVIGDILYGMVASNIVGFDGPFAYNLATGNFLNIVGAHAGNIPASPPSSGAWTPPVMAAVAGRIIVTHPGFGPTASQFGWLDISGFSETTTADTTNGNAVLSGNPSVLGVQPGMTVVGAGIPANALVVSTEEIVINTTLQMRTPTTITLLNDGFLGGAIGLAAGQSVAGAGIPANTVVLSVNLADASVQISNAAISDHQPDTLVFSVATTGNTHNGTMVIDGLATTYGLAVGMTVVDTAGSVPANTYITAINSLTSITVSANSTASTSADNFTFSITKTGNVYSGSLLLSGTAIVGVTVGMEAAGLGIPAGALVSAVTSTTVQITKVVTETQDFAAVTFTGGQITLNQAATATASGVSVTIAGGTTTQPLWGSGSTDRNGLPSDPVGVVQFFGRAYYACRTDGVVFSDSGFPCRVSNTTAVQALTTNDGLAVTAIAPVMLSSPLLTGGIVSSLIVFEGTTKMQQIAGDQALGNLTMDPLQAPTGTASPLSIFGSEMGTGFMSPDGLRFVRFDGTVSDPLGDAGSGITMPFISAVQPSRICAAANRHTIRVSVQNGSLPGVPQQEWWFDLGRKTWTGPHTFPASLIQPWRQSFAMAPLLISGTLFQSDVVPSLSSTYVEDDQPMTWAYTPTPLPDSGAVAQNCVVEMLLAAQLPLSGQIAINAYDIGGEALDSTIVQEPVTSTWGPGFPGWDTQMTSYQQLTVDWNEPLVFKQLVINATGPCANGVRIGNLFMRVEALAYKLQAA